jgi:hypothetical protein
MEVILIDLAPDCSSLSTHYYYYPQSDQARTNVEDTVGDKLLTLIDYWGVALVKTGKKRILVDILFYASPFTISRTNHLLRSQAKVQGTLIDTLYGG